MITRESCGSDRGGDVVRLGQQNDIFLISTPWTPLTAAGFAPAGIVIVIFWLAATVVEATVLTALYPDRLRYCSHKYFVPAFAEVILQPPKLNCGAGGVAGVPWY